ncbi:MAG: hypothetical protein WCC64_04930 [Aliidongia sp.]
MSNIAGLHRPISGTVASDKSESSEWSPRARLLTIIAAALASWAVVGAIVYLISAAVWG